MNRPILGCIADDLTGATDLGNNLARAGMRVALTIDIPNYDQHFEADAIVVALKSRTIPAGEAVAQSLQTCRWLQRRGVRQIYFKICSTFDSTLQGNIGPVIDALMNELCCDFSCVVPAFPDNGRTVYQGHLFVDDALLSESGMRNHSLTPMTDANLVRFLQLQLSGGKNRKTGLIDHHAVAESPDAIRKRITELRELGVSIAVCDTIRNDDLTKLACALRDAPMVTAGSGLAIALPSTWAFHPSTESSRFPRPKGRKIILSGSCSAATNSQVAHFIKSGGAARFLDPRQLFQNREDQVDQALAWADACWSYSADLPVLVYSTAAPSAVKSLQDQLGVERSGVLIEQTLSTIAGSLSSKGVGKLVVAGGETAGVCVRALGIQQMQIGPQIEPGVPWCHAALPTSAYGGIHIALKSGNFGSEDFFTRAFALLDEL